MKPPTILLVLIAMTRSVLGSESMLTLTYQPLDGLGSGRIVISQVTCHDGYATSGRATAINLISAPNVPPTNKPAAADENLNLASVCGVGFDAGDLGDPKAPRELTMDLTKFEIPRRFEHPREDIVRACLECLRRCLPDLIKETPLTLIASETDKLWVSGIVREFNTHDRRKVFFEPAL